MAHYADILQANVNGFTNSEIDEWRNVVVSKHSDNAVITADEDFALENMPYTQYKTKRQMVEEGERQIVEGRCGTTDDLVRICEERLKLIAR